MAYDSIAASLGARTTQDNPFGLSGASRVPFAPISGPQNQAPANPTAPTTYKPVHPPPIPKAGALPATTTAPSTAPSTGGYNPNTDPAFLQIDAYLGMSDEQANAAADKQRRNAILAYGDKKLALAITGDPTFADAVDKNPSSTLKQRGRQRERNVYDFTEGTNKANLFYGGYRIKGEGQMAQDYQDTAAGDASTVNSALDTINNNLAAALGANNLARIQALQAARDRGAKDPGTGAQPDPYNVGSDVAQALDTPQGAFERYTTRVPWKTRY